MKMIVDFAVSRMKERSTWIGLIGLLASFGIQVEPAMVEAIAGVGIALASVIMILTKDMKDKLPKVDAE